MDNQFIMIPIYASQALNLKHDDLIVYGIIYGFSIGKTGKYFGSLKYIQDITGCSQEHICRILKRLTEKGYIKKTVISTRKVEYTAVPLDELNLGGKNAVNASNLLTDYETQSMVGNHITEDKNAICDEMDAINDKQPDKPQITKEEAEKKLAAIRARLLNKK